MASDIRFVYFDLGNILVSFDRNLASDNVADLFGGTREASDEILHVGGLQNQLETGLISEEEFAQAVRDAYATLVQPNGMVATGDIMRAISDMFTPIESMVAVLQSLREAKVPIGILSNTCAAHWNWVNGRGWEIMSGPFDVQVVSYEAQSMKPDRVIYETAMKLASECLTMRNCDRKKFSSSTIARKTWKPHSLTDGRRKCVWAVNRQLMFCDDTDSMSLSHPPHRKPSEAHGQSTLTAKHRNGSAHQHGNFAHRDTAAGQFAQNRCRD